MLAEAKADIMILLAEDVILADQIEAEKKAILTQDSVIAKLSNEVNTCSLDDSENDILREEVEKLRRENAKLHQESKEMLKGIEERSQKIDADYHNTEKMRRRVETLEEDIVW